MSIKKKTTNPPNTVPFWCEVKKELAGLLRQLSKAIDLAIKDAINSYSRFRDDY